MFKVSVTLLLLGTALPGCGRTDPPVELQPGYAYTVAPMEGSSLFFTGDEALWRSYRRNVGTPTESGEFHIILGRAREPGVLGFCCPSLGIVAQGPAFSPLRESDTILLTSSATDTVSMTIGTAGGTWIGDSGRLIVRQIIDTFLIADFDLWFGIESNPPSGPLRLSGSMIATGTGNDTIP